MTNEAKAKIFIASISAVFLDDRFIAEPANRLDGQPDNNGILVCRLKEGQDSTDAMFLTVRQQPLLFLWVTEEEARASALLTAKKYLPEEIGFSNHAVLLTEIPRATFVEAQVLMSVREAFRWLLRLTGFSRGPA